MIILQAEGKGILTVYGNDWKLSPFTCHLVRYAVVSHYFEAIYHIYHLYDTYTGIISKSLLFSYNLNWIYQ